MEPVVAVSGTIAAVAAGVAGIGYLVKTARPGFRWAYSAWKGLDKIADVGLVDKETVVAEVARQLEPLQAELHGIRGSLHVIEVHVAELEPNGGKSMKDQLSKVEEQVKELHKMHFSPRPDPPGGWPI